ncbi:hypothetical protein D187_003175 [Cystobacter fuscus DSM 2262]|uniref:Uncharacterized protein n=1 Tax=Cystobacter fuscus (strain ATCC 25194 / DSM 2262 / NBRC 100088 / M29) TaxID=1242864 RepID=S9P805_CYSF2|nr:hypothetical protein D187_003175 [Cystobacter fuscus DSM 2262]
MDTRAAKCSPPPPALEGTVLLPCSPSGGRAEAARGEPRA